MQQDRRRAVEFVLYQVTSAIQCYATSEGFVDKLSSEVRINDQVCGHHFDPSVYSPVHRHTKLPCREEREIIEALVRLFDAHVYNSVLKSSAEHRVDTTIKSSLDQICDTLMTLARKYRQWFQSMRNTQAKYLQSNLLSILADQELLREIEEMVDIKTAAKNSIRDTKTLVCLQPSENTLDHLRYVLKMRELRAARRGASGRS